MNNSSNSREQMLSVIDVNFQVTRGMPLPLGATLMKNGINFAVYSAHASWVNLVLFLPGSTEPLFEFPMDDHYYRTGHVWHIMIQGIDRDIEYGFRMDKKDNPNPRLFRFDSRRVLLDPYARAIVGGEEWGSRDLHGKFLEDEEIPTPRRSKIVLEPFDWHYESMKHTPLADSIIYELHVRSFTRHSSSGVKSPGTFLGLIEKIPYLKDLGITAVELMPVTEFDEGENQRTDPESGERLLNLWGYSPLGFFAPNASYSSGAFPGCQVNEFKAMVKAFHEAGIEVILDVVFNHTAEGNEAGPTLSFRGIDNSTYYMIDPWTGRYHNYSGCGNTLNCNHPVVRDLVLDCLRYWVMEMHVDGFRFDLASILGRGQKGEVLHNPPLLERIAADPVLADTKLIAEAWDAAGLYQVGHFPNWGRWAEWNGKFRDDLRRFLRAEPGLAPAMATRIAGSADLYQAGGRQPGHSINFVTSHDGFTLNDLVSYDAKHNESNGEDNRDGANDNYSWNCGVEGPTDDSAICEMRLRQMKNAAAILMLSRGVPMILAGDEFARTQRGNNNAYCQDNEIGWLDWTLAEKNAGLLRFFKQLIRLRKAHPVLRYNSFTPRNEDWAGMISWHGTIPFNPDWSMESRQIALMIHGGVVDCDFYLALNSHWDKALFHIPESPKLENWARIIDTASPSPEDIMEEDTPLPLESQGVVLLQPRSMVLLRSVR